MRVFSQASGGRVAGVVDHRGDRLALPVVTRATSTCRRRRVRVEAAGEQPRAGVPVVAVGGHGAAAGAVGHDRRLQRGHRPAGEPAPRVGQVLEIGG